MDLAIWKLLMTFKEAVSLQRKEELDGGHKRVDGPQHRLLHENKKGSGRWPGDTELSDGFTKFWGLGMFAGKRNSPRRAVHEEFLGTMCRRWRQTACEVPADGLGLKSREEERKPGWGRRQDEVEDSD